MTGHDRIGQDTLNCSVDLLDVLEGRFDVGVFTDSQLSILQVKSAGSAYLHVEVVARAGYCIEAEAEVSESGGRGRGDVNMCVCACVRVVSVAFQRTALSSTVL